MSHIWMNHIPQNESQTTLVHSKVISLLNSLYYTTTKLTFENNPFPTESKRKPDDSINTSMALHAPTSGAWYNFSEVNLLHNLLYHMTIKLTFENFLLHSTTSSAWSNISKAQLLLNLLHDMTVELTFENFSRWRCTPPRKTILKSQLATQFMIWYEYKIEF